MRKKQKRRQRRSRIVLFARFALIDPTPMVAADPLAPAMQVQGAPAFVTRQLRIANEPQMGFEAGVRKRLTEAGHAAGKASGAGIGVRAFKGEEGFVNFVCRSTPHPFQNLR